MIPGEVTEATYAADLKEWINEAIHDELRTLKSAKVEIAKDRKRADVIVYDTENRPILVIEVKRPEVLPFEMEVRKQASGYAELFGPSCRQYATHNVNMLVLWDSVTQAEIDEFSFTYIRRLEEYLRNADEVKASVRRFLKWYVGYLAGAPPTPLDERIVTVVNRSIKGIISTTDWIALLKERYVSNADFRRNFQQWLVERGWTDPGANQSVLDGYCVTLASQFLYLLVNKVLFYNVLREKYPTRLSRLGLPPDLSADDFHPMLAVFLKSAERVSGDYQTVFETDFVDHLPLTAQAVVQIRQLLEYLNSLDYSSMGNFDVIGKVFEHLVPEEERHLHGQFFTRTDLVDLLLAFSLRSKDANLLDPACGSGTFLVRGYHRLRYLRGASQHTALLPSIWGVDLDKFAAHFSTINLARQDLVSQENYPNIVHSDFFAVAGPNAPVRIGLQTNILDWSPDASQPTANVAGLDSTTLERTVPFFVSIAGNPPFTEQRELIASAFGEDYKAKLLARLKFDFPDLSVSVRSGIYVYFVIHAMRFLRAEESTALGHAPPARLSFIMLRNWLDVEYGDELKSFLLDHAKVKVIIESRDEEWFPSAQMLPIALVLEPSRNSEERKANAVRFVQIKKPLSELIPPLTDERNQLQEVNRWQKVDELVAEIEGGSLPDDLSSGEIGLRTWDTDSFRIIEVPQRALQGERKWSQFLSAPQSFFRIKSQKRDFLVALSAMADLRRGLTSPKAAFFYMPNTRFSIQRLADFTELREKKSGEVSFRIENRYVQPMLLKLQSHQSVEIQEADGYGLFVPNISESELRDTGLKAYLDYGLQVFGDALGKLQPGGKPWFVLEKPEPAPILVRSLYLARYTAFRNPHLFPASNPFFEVRPRKGIDADALLAVLNSSLTFLMLEFAGRYRENRDRTITNQISLDDMRHLLVLDPSKLTDDIRDQLKQQLRRLLPFRQSPDGIVNRRDVEARKGLDEVVFLGALGLGEHDMQDSIEGLKSLVMRRLRKAESNLADSEPEGES